MRIDVYLVEKGLCISRNKAKDLLLKGGVRINGASITKPSVMVSDEDIVEIEQEVMLPYVSKGGLKLKKAIDNFGLDFKGKYILDIGASTGGFTDCALKHGAEYVWAIDVGTSQLVAELKKSDKVCSVENIDIRNLSTETIGRLVDIVVADLSFISLKLIVNHIPKFLSDSGFAILLIKPQFEVGVKNIGKGGIVNNHKAHILGIMGVVEEAKRNGLYLVKLAPIPIIDSRKNIEYLAMFKTQEIGYVDIMKVVKDVFLEKKCTFRRKELT